MWKEQTVSTHFMQICRNRKKKCKDKTIIKGERESRKAWRGHGGKAGEDRSLSEVDDDSHDSHDFYDCDVCDHLESWLYFWFCLCAGERRQPSMWWHFMATLRARKETGGKRLEM